MFGVLFYFSTGEFKLWSDITKLFVRGAVCFLSTQVCGVCVISLV